MDAEHFDTFGDWFDVLAVTHRLTASEDLRVRMKAEYFDVLRPYPLEAVASSYESLRRKMKKWPVPADWLENLPPFGSVMRLPLASPEEIAENDEAEKLGYERAHVCTCQACVAADCFLPPRYVPRIYDGAMIERRHPTKQGRPLLLGRWIHGEELKRWYRARANFYAQKALLAPTLPIFLEPADRIARIAIEANALQMETKA